jgi:hypothetical protein
VCQVGGPAEARRLGTIGIVLPLFSLTAVLWPRLVVARGIEIPFPHRSVYMGTASSPLEVMLHTTPSVADGGR